ncbi:hypothetical protein POL68_41275 [Stigmatella sp. ncwal1]|uniref:Uncharacterized protein n=1 Tax=Stigmatella ashevillensis TaxID=2995309 RepID=A0ABT5DMX0_9BACT|nr:hypothetical protein [Stigmatella ashevillena]MDC0714953.1 hypothetical protein [Stigmatella ashevillena]
MSADRDIDEWLAGHGLTLPASRERARACLAEEKIINPKKARMSEQKLERATALLAERFYRVCGAPACLQVAHASGREPVTVEPRTHCERCGGSDNRRAVVDFLEACHRKSIRRLVVVGGSPAVREELEDQLGTRLELRMVDGTERRTADKARHDLDWADLVLVWGATELHHKVSEHYTGMPPPLNRKVVHVVRRGVASLLAEAITHLNR